MDEPLPHAYCDLGIYRIVPFIYEQYKQRRYKNEAIMKLKKHDEQHGTDFYIRFVRTFNTTAI